MPTFLSDPPQAVYLILGVLLVVTGAIAAQRQNRKSAQPFLIALLLMLLVFLLDKFSESPREEAIRRVQLMQMAADAKNPEAFVEHVADRVDVQTGQGQTRTATRDELTKSGFWALLRQFNVQVSVTGFSRDDVKVINDNKIEIGFVAKGHFPDGKSIPVYAQATFSKQTDGSFKLTEFKTFEFIDRTKAFPIPNFP